MARIPLVAGNWKMHKSIAEARALIAALRAAALPDGVEVAVCPPFTALAAAAAALAGSPIRLGAQDVYWEPQGAFTGEIAPPMLTDLGCHYVIVGHSERRQWFGDTDETVARKVQAAFSAGLVPIACVGERLEEREEEQTARVVTRQARAAIADLSAGQVASLVIAYEPVWAIGTGRSASGADAGDVISLLRRLLADQHGGAAAQTRILYGGSVTPENIGQFMSQRDIDGALVGGASLDAGKFIGIIRGAARA
ncbi:MAG TPA: triose-phosphate isomerase [bacterium]|nr:triose-phosphate isomerase [bacterium]